MVNSTLQSGSLVVVQMIVNHARTMSYHREDQVVVAAMLDRLDWLLTLLTHSEDRSQQFVQAVVDFCQEFKGCGHLKQATGIAE
jgi:hypothetical protein